MDLPYLISRAGDYTSQYASHYLSRSNSVPVPELPAYVVPLGLLAVLGASVWLLRKRSLNAPVLMK